MPPAAELPSTAVAQAAEGPLGETTGEWQAELLDLGKAFRRVFRSLRRLRGRDTHLIGSEVSHAQMELLIELSEQGPLSAGGGGHAAPRKTATRTPNGGQIGAPREVEGWPSRPSSHRQPSHRCSSTWQPAVMSSAPAPR